MTCFNYVVYNDMFYFICFQWHVLVTLFYNDMFFIYFDYNDIFSNYFVYNDMFSNYFVYNDMFLITLFTMTCFTSVCIHIKSIFTVGCTEYFFTHFICIWNKARNWLKSGKYCVIFAPAVWSYLWNLSFFVRIPFIKSSKWFLAKQNASD